MIKTLWWCKASDRHFRCVPAKASLSDGWMDGWMVAWREFWCMQEYRSVCFVGLCACVYVCVSISVFSSGPSWVLLLFFPWQAVLIGWPWGKEISCLAPNQHASLIHHPLPPQLWVRLCVCACVKEKESKSKCQREVCAFRRSHTPLFLLKCFSSSWRRLMRYDITALCFIFKRWAGSPSLPLNEAEVPTEYMEGLCECVCQKATFLLFHMSACKQCAWVCFWFSAHSR